MKILFLIFCFLPLQSFSNEVCFSTLEEYERVKKSLPPVFQKIPAYFTYSALFNLGGIAIQIIPVPSLGKIKLEGGYYKPSEAIKHEDGAYIKKICINTSTGTATLTLESGKIETLTNILDDSAELNVRDKATNEITKYKLDHNSSHKKYSELMKTINSRIQSQQAQSSGAAQ